MRKIITILFVFTICILSTGNLFADTFASYIRFTQPADAALPFDGKFDDGTGVAVRFVLSDAADSVIISIKSGVTLVNTLKNANFKAGDTLVVWDGKDSGGNIVAKGNYSVSISTMNLGYFEYTQISNQGLPISTRGATCVKNPAVKNFGFIFAASSGDEYATGVARHSADGTMWGDKKGAAKLTTTGIALGGANARYSSEADNAGFIYVIGRDNRQLLRYHTDSLVVTVVDSSGYAGWFLNGIAIRENNGKFIALVANNSTSAIGTDSKVFGFELGTKSNYFGTKVDVLVGDTTIIFWDVAFGRDNKLYATFSSKTDNIRPGIAAFNYTGTTLHMKDTLWTSTVAAGRGNTCCYYTGPTADKDVLYFTIARRTSGDATAVQNIFCVSNLTTTKDQGIAFKDPENNMTQYRSDITVDAVGNIIYFENSNEAVTIIAPPNGINRFTTPAVDPLVTSGVLPVELSTFSAAVYGNSVTLNWTTATEKNNRGFDIERKLNGSWEKVGYVNGFGTTSEFQTYIFTDSKVAPGKYNYRLKQMDFDGTYSYCPLEQTVEVGNPNQYNLAQNYPNPFNPSTTISYYIPVEGKVTLNVYNSLGQVVKELVNEVRPAGSHSVRFDASNLSSGVYIYTLTAGNFNSSHKLVIMK